MLTGSFASIDAWEKRWVLSTHKGNDAGKFVLTAGKFYGDAEKSKGIQTSQVLTKSIIKVPSLTSECNGQKLARQRS
jgi:hypothetical protein